jgi:hypothetical protein
MEQFFALSTGDMNTSPDERRRWTARSACAASKQTREIPAGERQKCLLRKVEVEGVLDLVPEAGLAVAGKHPEVVSPLGNRVDKALSIGSETEADSGKQILVRLPLRTKLLSLSRLARVILVFADPVKCLTIF